MHICILTADDYTGGSGWGIMIREQWPFFIMNSEYGKSCISSYTRIVRTP